MGFWLLPPFFLLRFGLLARLNRDAVKRAARFAPPAGGEKAAYWIYQLSNAGLLICLCFLKIRLAPAWLFGAGLAVYAAGLGLLAAAAAGFASPDENGMSRRGLYRFSRNPMYLSYFVFFAGCVLLTQSPVLLVLLLIFQLSSHWIILSEERWCKQTFGEAYLQYMKRVRRYL